MNEHEPEREGHDGAQFVTRTGRRLRSQYGPYRIITVLGEGGMGAIVLLAEDVDSGQEVALKVFSPDRRMTYEMRRRFKSGARASAGVDHPNVVKINTIGEEGGRPYFAMEFVRGRSLGDILGEEGRLAPHRAVEIILHVARGLRAAKQSGVIHRDIKPSNILISEDGVSKVSDFGIASIEKQDSVFLQKEMIVGTPEYMSPEMCEAKTVDHKSDIYSLGVTFYEVLAGRPPFHGMPVDIMYKQCHKRPKSIAGRVPTLHPRIARIIKKMIEKDSTRRYQDYDELIEELEDVQKRGLFTIRNRHRPGLATAIALGVGLGLLGGLWLGGFLGEPERGLDPDEQQAAELARLLQLPAGGFEQGVAPTVEEPPAGQWRILATGPLAGEPEKLALAEVSDASAAEGSQALVVQIQPDQTMAVTEELAFPTPWGVSVRLDGVKPLEGTPLTLSYQARGVGAAPELVVRIEEDPRRDTPLPAQRQVMRDEWARHEVEFSVEPASAATHTMYVRFFVAGSAGDRIWLDDVRLQLR